MRSRLCDVPSSGGVLLAALQTITFIWHLLAALVLDAEIIYGSFVSTMLQTMPMLQAYHDIGTAAVMTARATECEMIAAQQLEASHAHAQCRTTT